MFGRLVAGLIVIVLAFGVWIVWPRGEPEPSSTLSADDSSTNSTTSMATSQTTPTETTTTTEPVVAVIETVEQAEDLLRVLWLGWFEGIYNQDEDRIKEVVASQSHLDSARAAFGVATFSEAPTSGQILLSDTEILFSDAKCVVIWSNVDVTGFRGDGATTTTVEVIRLDAGVWKFVGSWRNKGDLWEQDCESQLEPLS
jgi:hypothetical protein